MKAAIIGLGVVGQAQERMFGKRHDLVTYDPKYNDHYPQAYIAECAFAVISVNTPAKTDGSCDLSYVRSAVAALPTWMPVMLRSTVPVGTTEKLALGRAASVVHVPEFMHESPAGAWHESSDVPFIMLGGSPYAREFFKPILSSVTSADIWEARSDETELAKLVVNSYWAVKLAFVNHVADICQDKNLNYDTIRSLWLAHPQTDAAYTKMAGYERGFGGACLPKDLADLATHLPSPNLFDWVSDWNDRLS